VAALPFPFLFFYHLALQRGSERVWLFFFSPLFSSSVFGAFFYANQKIKDVMGWDEAF
jgi:hypothetical protein